MKEQLKEPTPEELLSMKVNETREFNPEKHRTLLTNKSTLKRNGKGEWKSSLSFMGLFAKRTK